jgi:hypothetical protein
LISQEFNFSLRGDFLCCVRHGVNLLRNALYACEETMAYMEDGNPRRKVTWIFGA